MSSTRAVRPQAVSAETPAVPLTIEGYSVLHQMMRVRWPAWRELSAAQKNEIVNEASTALAKMEQSASGQSGLYSLLGHKGDLMLVHFRQSFDDRTWTVRIDDQSVSRSLRPWGGTAF